MHQDAQHQSKGLDLLRQINMFKVILPLTWCNMMDVVQLWL